MTWYLRLWFGLVSELNLSFLSLSFFSNELSQNSNHKVRTTYTSLLNTSLKTSGKQIFFQYVTYIIRRQRLLVAVCTCWAKINSCFLILHFIWAAKNSQSRGKNWQYSLIIGRPNEIPLNNLIKNRRNSLLLFLL